MSPPASAGTDQPQWRRLLAAAAQYQGSRAPARPQGAGSASGQVQVALSGEGAAARKILIQTAHRDTRGQARLLQAQGDRAARKARRGSWSSGEVMRMLKTVQRKSLSMLGPLIDPEKDCKLIKDEDNLKIKIESPGGKMRSLAP